MADSLAIWRFACSMTIRRLFLRFLNSRKPRDMFDAVQKACMAVSILDDDVDMLQLWPEYIGRDSYKLVALHGKADLL